MLILFFFYALPRISLYFLFVVLFTQLKIFLTKEKKDNLFSEIYIYAYIYFFWYTDGCITLCLKDVFTVYMLVHVQCQKDNTWMFLSLSISTHRIKFRKSEVHFSDSSIFLKSLMLCSVVFIYKNVQLEKSVCVIDVS